MPDVEKVINGLEMSYRYSNVDDGNTLVPQQLVLDALALLKAQEPVAPVQRFDGDYICGACGNGIVGCDVFDEAGIESVKNDYCPTCGRRVKWC